ncbi:MAG: potassium channel family protein [Anaerolineae bacterium]
MRVLIVGGGLTGSELARLLLQEGQQVTVVEEREEILAKLHKEIPQARLVLGDGCEPSTLEQAGVRKMDVVAAVTGHDEDNLVVCLLAKQEFRVRRTLGRVNNAKNEWLFTRDMGVDVSVSGAHIMASLLREEMATLEMAVLMRLHQGDIALVEDLLTPESKAVGKAIRELPLPDNAILVAIVRGKDLILPKGTVALQAGDRVLALVRPGERQQLAAAFG